MTSGEQLLFESQSEIRIILIDFGWIRSQRDASEAEDGPIQWVDCPVVSSTELDRGVEL